MPLTVTVTEIASDRTHRDTGGHDHVREFKAQVPQSTALENCRTILVRAQAVLEGTLPGVGSKHPDDLGAVCVDVDGYRDFNHPWLFYFAATYSDRVNVPAENPLLEPARVSYGGSMVMVPFNFALKVGNRNLNRQTDGDYFFDDTGLQPDEANMPTTPVLNSAHDPFTPLPEYEEPRSELIITKNLATLNVQMMMAYRGVVNSDLWFGLYPGQGRIGIIQAETQFFGERSYWRVTVPIALNPEGFDFDLQDTGFRAHTGWEDVGGVQTPVREKIKGRDEEGISEPALLNGNGYALPALPTFPSQQLGNQVAAVYIRYRKYKSASFGALGIYP